MSLIEQLGTPEQRAMEKREREIAQFESARAAAISVIREQQPVTFGNVISAVIDIEPETHNNEHIVTMAVASLDGRSGVYVLPNGSFAIKGQ